MTPTEAEVEAFARKLAAEAGWERYVDTARRTLEAAPTDASMTDTLPAEAIEAAATALYGPWGARPGYLGDQYRRQARAALLAALPHIRGAEAGPGRGVTVTPLYLHPDPSDREGIVAALRRIVAAYDREVLMRTADVHSAGCECLRCAIDNAEDALRKMGAGR